MFFCLLFLLTELTYKYIFIESEEFYFKIPTLGFVIGQFILQLLLYPDVFGWGVVRTGTKIQFALRIFLSIITYPFWTILFFIRFLFLHPNEVWNEFTIIGMANLFFVVTILFAGSTYNLIRAEFSKNFLGNKKNLLFEGLSRIFFLISMLIGNIVWFFFPFFFQFSFMFMILFLMGYMVLSLGFIVKERILLPIEPPNLFPMFTIVQNKYGLTYAEAEIVEAVYEGLSRLDIKKKFSHKEENLKKYLSSIYKKIFKSHKDLSSTGRDKFQRLTFILNNKIDRTNSGG